MKRKIDAYLRTLKVLDEAAKESGKAPSQVSLNWVINRPAVSSAIVGATRPEQLEENAGAADWKLSDEWVHRLDEAFSPKG